MPYLFYALTFVVSLPLTAAERDQFTDVKSALNNVGYDIRYFGKNNFVGQPIDGYMAEKCLVHSSLIPALQKANNTLLTQGYRLKFFDCYRPEKAVTHFMRWAQDLNDTRTKNTYYPNLNKSKLVGDYIAEKSGHSKGFTVDITLEKQLADNNWQEVDMGSAFDMFDPISNTTSPKVTPQQQRNRQLLNKHLVQVGFSNYSMEWWHFTYTAVAKEKRSKAYNFDIK